VLTRRIGPVAPRAERRAIFVGDAGNDGLPGLVAESSAAGVAVAAQRSGDDRVGSRRDGGHLGPGPQTPRGYLWLAASRRMEPACRSV